MKKLTASLLAVPLLLSGAAFADGHKDKPEDPAAFHREMCGDRYAHAFGKTAYLQAKLGITDKQQAAWDAWQKVELDSAARERDDCLKSAPKGDQAPSTLDQESHIEAMLQDKLDELHASRAPLEALYVQLDSAQKEQFDHFGEWMHHPHGPMEMHDHEEHDGHGEDR